MNAITALRYLDRTPEFLVVKGYRNWLGGCATQDPRQWDRLRRLHALRLGETQAGVVVDGLVAFVSTLGRCATCPLRFFPSESCHLCRDECLVLSLVAAIQHGDEESCRLSAGALVCPLRAPETVIAAGDYAMRLKYAGCMLLPIPPLVVSDFIAANPVRHNAPQARTIH